MELTADLQARLAAAEAERDQAREELQQLRGLANDTVDFAGTPINGPRAIRHLAHWLCAKGRRTAHRGEAGGRRP